jgi:hypothetical protein
MLMTGIGDEAGANSCGVHELFHFLLEGVHRVCVATRVDGAPILPERRERSMANFLAYNPEQGYLLPPTVREVLGEEHLCFFVHAAVENLDLRELEAGYSEEGHPAYQIITAEAYPKIVNLYTN